ncbi:ImmA/IrrE family metallo-endopeptidase [Enterococcus sp. 1001283B150225_161107_E12]|uniref:ImmA/IrrE family metallo-endopeptidase n=1 Tax=Enterococcus sp. 1001283B150225_161107_E12 TaxID=2787145 RepID=UPI001E48F5B5|nr:ImmA/IrrE family metallo-endopeptidase [Enterococcus sp. 1001283B150225_161107_E12]
MKLKKDSHQKNIGINGNFMYLPHIHKKLNSIIHTHESRDPFKIAKDKRIFILEEELGEIFGYYNRIKRIQFIHINTSLSEDLKLFVCSHELGHCICHSNENTPQLSSMSITSEMKVEKEANYFATNLIIDGRHKELQLPTKYEILDYYGLPWYLDRYIYSRI